MITMKTKDGKVTEICYDNKTRRVVWMSDWCLAHSLRMEGKLHSIHYGSSTYGHIDYVVPGED